MAKIAKTSNGFSATKPSHDDIAKRAYDIYERSGCQPGREMENWLAAETELIAATQKQETSRPRATSMSVPPQIPRRQPPVMAARR